MRPKQDKNAEWELMIGATIADNNDGTLYTDQTGAFPVVSYKGNKLMFVAYEYRSNAIIAKPIRSNSDESLVTAFKEVYEYLSDKGFKPKLNVMDNQCSKAVQKYLTSHTANGMSLRLSPLYSYRSRGGTNWYLLLKGDFSTTKVVPRNHLGTKRSI